ncbi:MAG TPA: protein kinase, partial [Kofleriaceae bacterium]|nr:protein kinase [Kofleriaceae bacterium]
MQPTNPERTGGCAAVEELALYVVGRLREPEREALEAHMAACERCRRAVSALAATELGTTGEVGQDGFAPADAGGVVGRFVLTRHLGRGAMGEVWAARDPELGREVALKFLGMNADALTEEASDRMRREAQAMARLNHPNAVTIYELCEADGQLFCAMELVAGVTLRSWLGEPRRWTEVIDIALGAGRGLAAAHAAGLVHRDVKPDNILIDDEGRARVSDFGVAKLVGLDEPAGRVDERGPVDEPVRGATETGALVGTPAYMAPEQLDCREVDARSDQFSFCVTFWEALFGERPFPAGDLAGLIARVRAGPRPPADRRGAPRPLVRALLRGLAVDPAARWPSMDALVGQLERVRARPRRRRMALVGAAAVAAMLAGAVALAVWTVKASGEGDARGAARSRIGRAWGPAQEQALATHLRESGHPAAAGVLAVLVRSLDQYRDGWVRMRVDAWAATHVRGEQDRALLERRLACLDRLADQLGALVGELGALPAEEVPDAPALVADLLPISICADRDRLLSMVAPSQSAPAQAAEADLAAILALTVAGRHEEAVTRAGALLARTENDPRDRAIAAYTLYALGVAQSYGGKPEAEATLRRAIEVAAAARDHYLVARAWNRLILHLGETLRRPDEALALAPAASAAIDQAGADAVQRADLRIALASAEHQRGSLPAARDHFTAALNGYRAAAATDVRHEIRVVQTEAALGGILIKLGELAAARAMLAGSLARLRRTYGDLHPNVASTLQNLAVVAQLEKDWPAAEKSGRQALEVARKVLPPGDVGILQIHRSLALSLRHQKRIAGARAELEAARAEFTRSGAPDPLEVARTDLTLCDLEQNTGADRSSSRTVEVCRRAADGVTRALGADHPLRATALAHLALSREEQAPGEALDLYSE